MGISLIMKYFINKNIQSIFLDNKCKISEKQLVRLADFLTYDLKKNPESKFDRTFAVKVKRSVENK